jgi:hypothetical protein
MRTQPPPAAALKTTQSEQGSWWPDVLAPERERNSRGRWSAREAALTGLSALELAASAFSSWTDTSSLPLTERIQANG